MAVTDTCFILNFYTQTVTQTHGSDLQNILNPSALIFYIFAATLLETKQEKF